MTRTCRRPSCRQTVLTWLHPHYCSISCRDHVWRGIPATLAPAPTPAAPLRPPRPVPTQPSPPPKPDLGWVDRMRLALRARSRR